MSEIYKKLSRNKKFRFTAFKSLGWSTPHISFYDYSDRKNSYTVWDISFGILCWEFAFGRVFTVKDFKKFKEKMINQPLIGGDRSDELIAIDTDGGSKVLIDPSEHFEFPRDGYVYDDKQRQ